eukprot:14417812-Ditylum_brightwellii.AAC.2
MLPSIMLWQTFPPSGYSAQDQPHWNCLTGQSTSTVIAPHSQPAKQPNARVTLQINCVPHAVAGIVAAGGQRQIPYQILHQMPILALEQKTLEGKKTHRGMKIPERALHPFNPRSQSSQTTPSSLTINFLRRIDC